MDLHLSGRVAVVTGASKGIGLAVTRTLLEEGARVVAASRGRSSELDALAGTEDLLHVSADLTEPGAPAEVIARAVETFGGLDILVNNAGGPPPGTKLPQFGFLGLTDDAWQAMLDFNLITAVRACRAAIPLLVERGGGSIVNVTSGHARQPSAVNVHYGAAKSAMANLTKALSEEFGAQGVRVNSVCPGPVNTPWWTEPGGAADIISAATGADRATLMTVEAPAMMALVIGRLAEPQEIADAIVLLASPRSASTTGSEVVVDSGFLKAA